VQSSSPNSSNNGAHSFDMAQLKLRKEIVVFAPFVLPRVGMCAPPPENWSFDSGSAHVVLSGKTNGVVAAHVSCNRHRSMDASPCSHSAARFWVLEKKKAEEVLSESPLRPKHCSFAHSCKAAPPRTKMRVVRAQRVVVWRQQLTSGVTTLPLVEK